MRPKLAIHPIFLLAIFLLLFAEFASCDSGERPENWSGLVSVEENSTPNNAHLDIGHQTQKNVFDGASAVMLNGENPYGLTLSFSDCGPGTLTASVWKWKDDNGTGFLVAQSEDSDLNLYKSSRVTGLKEKGWEQHSLSLRIPVEKTTKLKLYVWSPKGDVNFFDRLEFSFESNSSLDHKPGHAPDISLELDSLALAKIKKVRKRALKRGLLITEEDDWVEGLFKDEQDSISCELRLKGDWPDHLRGKKWSFRIKTDKRKYWKGMRTFSLQSPAARGFLNEWLFHKALENQDVLTTRYDFFDLNVNGEELGLYAMEEHFDKHLPMGAGREEGPILKFDETGFWELIYRDQQAGIQTMKSVPFFESSTIAAFKKNRTLKSKGLAKQFAFAQSLLQQYRDGIAPFSEIFDLDRMAKFLAMVDLFEAYHATRWHNMRFYYNPLTSRLEPIAYDGFGAKPEFSDFKFMAYQRQFDIEPLTGEAVLLEYFFKDLVFFARYNQYLLEFCNEDFVRDLMDEFGEEVNKWESLISEEFKGYTFDRDRIINRSKGIADLIQLKKDASLKAKRIVEYEGMTKLQLENQHCLPIEVIGIGDGREEFSFPLPEPFVLPAFQKARKNTRMLRVNGVGSHVYIRVLGTKPVTIVPISS